MPLLCDRRSLALEFIFGRNDIGRMSQAVSRNDLHPNNWIAEIATSDGPRLRGELPLWQVRRIAYDSGEWYCALSRERELPDWLDQSIEARHADLALAILAAFVEAQRISAPQSRASVPAVGRLADPLYEPLCSDNFG